MISNAPNINHRWAGLLVEELVRSGVDFFCLAPGSRSTPLTTAVARHPKARNLVHFDERGTAFYALGYARATGRPAAWITTSGTAVANGLPAVVEAGTDGVPMLLLTADRPPELRQTGANQTVDQVGLFGGYTRWAFDLPAPDPALDPAMLLTTVDQAVYRALRAPRGPVHLNLMFREPLEPSPTAHEAPLPPSLHAWQAHDAPYTRYSEARPAAGEAEVERLWTVLREAERGLLVVGRLDAPAQAEAARTLAAALGWPLLPDVGSGLRLGDAAPPAVPYYDQILAHAAFAAAHRPDVVLHLGGRSTSKRLAQYLQESRPRAYVGVREHPFRLDPSHQATWSIEADLVAFSRTLAVQAAADGGVRGSAPGWLPAWQAASQRVAARLDAFFAEPAALSEPLVARLVSRHLPEGHGLFLASSMPVRDMDLFAAPGGPQAVVGANRGASGIDGLVATAAGFARGLDRPVTLVIGDLALLHDLNSLALLAAHPVPLTVVVVNNDGGGIFSFLPIAAHADVFEPYFGTPHGRTFAAAAELFGLDYHRPAGPAAFLDAYRAAARAQRSTLIEVTTDRRENLALHRQLQAWVTPGLDDLR